MEFLISSFWSLLYVLEVALGIGLVIFVHELGHFAVAKWVGVRVDRFSLGFGPVVWRCRRGETEYALSAFPLGGYVKMLGQDDVNPGEMSSEEIKLDPRSYPAQSVPKRMAIISAGVVMNLIFGFLLFILVFNLGVSFHPAVVGQLEPGGPAWQAGLERGDRIVKVDDEAVQEFEAFHQAVMLSDPAKGIDLTIERTGERRVIRVWPEMKEGSPHVGVGPSLALVLEQHLDEQDPKTNRMPVGFAASQVEGERFQSGDRITHVNGQAIGTYAEFADFLARHASETLRVGVTRASTEGQTNAATAEIHVRPQPLRDLGFRVQMGPITAVRRGSVAESAGLQVGDVIESVNGEPIDPFRLPNLVSNLQGEELKIALTRQTGSETTTEEVTVRPADEPAWTSPPFEDDPIAIPALGIAYLVVPIIAEEPAEDSPVAGVGLRPDDTAEGADAWSRWRWLIAASGGIVLILLARAALRRQDEPGKSRGLAVAGIVLAAIALVGLVLLPSATRKPRTPAEPTAQSLVGLQKGDQVVGAAVILPALDSASKPDEKPVKIDEKNPTLPGLFWYMQRHPQAKLKLKVERQSARFITEAFNPRPDPSWNSPIRGFPITRLSERLEPVGLTKAVGMGYESTKSTLVSIYLVLRGLVSRTVSPKNTVGPVLIATIAYQEASVDPMRLIKFIAMLSVNLAVINFLPIPVLDGGHMVFLTWEWIRGKPANERVLAAATYAGLALILTLVLVVTGKDIWTLVKLNLTGG